MGTCAAGGQPTGGVQSICPLSNFNCFHCIIMKWIIINLCDIVCWQNISAKFDNQPDLIKHFGVMALELAKIAQINRVRSVTSIFFNGSSSIFVTLFVGIISQAKFNNQPDHMKHFGVMAIELAKIAQINHVCSVT